MWIINDLGMFFHQPINISTTKHIENDLKDECPVNALRAQNLAGGHFLGHEIRLVFVSLSIWAILGIN